MGETQIPIYLKGYKNKEVLLITGGPLFNQKHNMRVYRGRFAADIHL